jgi:UDP-glucose 4-epimerase
VGRRLLITGIGSFWGSRVAQTLEDDADIEVIVGLGVSEPRVPLERTEYVKADQSYSILTRLVRATQVDTVLHTFLIVDSTRANARELHETNVIGTMNLLAAAASSDSPVRNVIVKSSALVYGSNLTDPVWFREDMARTAPAKTRVERSLLDVEAYIRDFAIDNPHVNVSLLRFSNVLGTDIVTPISRALSRPVAPSILGFDPMVQFVEEDDVVRALLFTLRHPTPGIFNVAGDGRLPWSEVAAICGKRLMPLPPFFTDWAVAPLALLNVLDLPPETLAFLRYGRGADNRRLKQAGFTYNYTSAGAVESFARASRLRGTIGESRPHYRYQRDVEAFFRHSAAVVRDPG